MSHESITTYASYSTPLSPLSPSYYKGRIWPTPTRRLLVSGHSAGTPALAPSFPFPDPSSSRPPLPGTAAKPALALLCSPAAPTSTPRLHQQGELLFHSPKSLNKKSRKQPRSTGLRKFVQSGQVPAHAAFDSARRLPSQVRLFLVTFSFDFV